jgi:hypothetical protein
VADWVAATTIMVASAAGIGDGNSARSCRDRQAARGFAPAQRQDRKRPEIARPVVFTLPAQIADIAYQSKTVLYDFKAPDDRLP